MTVISVENLGKAYRLGQIGTGTLSHDLNVWWAKARGKPNPLLKIGQKDHGNREGETIWALKDVSFEVKQGEVLGIIGRNGAGKSTLLKILTGVTAPTSGQIKAKGRVASLLEVGTGFHPELTGRENVYLNGAILGMKKMEIARRFDEIVAFSEVEQFIDTPVKRYSSGMYVRLAFAVAAHLDPEILLVDEVLAVGDAAFQKKCLGKMGDAAKGGRTVLFVSHNMVAVQSLCGNALWLERGSIAQRGRCSQVVAEYLQSSLGSGAARQDWDNPATAPGNEVVRLRRVGVCLERDTASGLITMESPFRIEVDYWNQVQDSRLHVTLHILNEQGVTAFTTGSARDPAWCGRPLPVGLYRSSCHVPGNLLNSGRYRVVLLVVKDLSKVIYQHDDVFSFDVVDLTERQAGWLGREPGVLQPLLKWTTEYAGSQLSVPRAFPDDREEREISEVPRR
jgi:lipopolysaccharide transport system ATP-binding protein